MYDWKYLFNVIMCKKKVAEVDDSKNIETSNYGIINLSEDNLGTMGIVEIVAIILLIMAIVMTCQYCVKKKKQRRMRVASCVVFNRHYFLIFHLGNTPDTYLQLPDTYLQLPDTYL